MTFADKLAALRKDAQNCPDTREMLAASLRFASFLVNHAAEIEALVRAAGNCQAHFLEGDFRVDELRQALAALEGK